MTQTLAPILAVLLAGAVLVPPAVALEAEAEEARSLEAVAEDPRPTPARGLEEAACVLVDEETALCRLYGPGSLRDLRAYVVELERRERALEANLRRVHATLSAEVEGCLQSRRLEVDHLRALAGESAHRAREAEARADSWRRWGPWAVAGGLLVGIGAGAYVAAQASSR